MTIKELREITFNLSIKAEFPAGNKFTIEIDKEFSESENFISYLSLWGENKDGSFPICGNDIIFKII